MGRRQDTSNDRANQAEPYQRTPPPAKASSRSSSSSSDWSTEPREPTSTGQGIDTTPHTEQLTCLVQSKRQKHRSVEPIIRRSRRTTSLRSGSLDASTHDAAATRSTIDSQPPQFEAPRSTETIHRPFHRNATAGPLVQARRDTAVLDSPQPHLQHRADSPMSRTSEGVANRSLSSGPDHPA